MTKQVKQISQPSQKISYKFIFIVSIVLFVTMGTTHYFNHVNHENNIRAQLEARGKSLGDFLALISPDAILGQDYLLMNRYIKELSHQPDVVYGVILSADGDNLTSYLNHENEIIVQSYSDDLMETIETIDSRPDVFSMQFPVDPESNLGTIIIGLSTKNIDQLSHDAFVQEIIEIILIPVFLSLCIYLLFKISIHRPLQEIVNSFQYVASGNFFHKAKVYSDDELGCLAKSFNQMNESLNQIHNEKDDMLEALQSTNEQLEVATKTKNNFLANMSHEIRTPLTAIIGFGEVLKKSNINDKEMSKAIDSIVENGIHLKTIINDILDISKIEANKLTVDISETSLFDILSKIASLFEQQCKDKGLSFNIDYQFPLPGVIRTDPLRFKQILINLCGNAVKFTESGHVNIGVHYDQNTGLLIIDVKDTGIGLTPEQQQKIFSRFTQADSSTSKKFGGTGLGLSLSLELAQMLGGAIKVQSIVDVGSCFSLSINPGTIASQVLTNMMPVRNDLSTSQTDLSKNISTLTGRILLAEDNLFNQDLISIHIGKTGASMDIANDGLEAIEYAMKNDYDLILMDMQMPNMDGIEAIKKLREKGYTKPISALTANAMQNDKEQFATAGSDEFLSKPIDENELYQLLEKYLSKNTTTDQPAIIQPGTEEHSPIQRLKNKFINELNTRSSELNEAFNTQNWNKLESLLHSLKGVSGNLGFNQIMNASIEVEADILNNAGTIDIDVINIKLKHLLEVINKSID